MKYLETNTIRKFASRLTEESFTIDKYTSILSLLEIISGIKNDESFILRKSILKKLIKSKIKIDLTFPELKICNAFGVEFNNKEIADKIAKIIQLIYFVKDYASLIKTINSNFLIDGWAFARQYDENANIGFKKSIAQRFPESGIKELIAQFEEKWTFENLNFLKRKVIDYYASIVLNNMPNPKKKTILDIISAYDNSIDIYLIATACYVDEKISFKNTAGKNDYLDLNHLIYLYKLENQIITDDKMLHKIMNRTYPYNILKANEI